jgi:hypothetical protein
MHILTNVAGALESRCLTQSPLVHPIVLRCSSTALSSHADAVACGDGLVLVTASVSSTLSCQHIPVSKHTECRLHETNPCASDYCVIARHQQLHHPDEQDDLRLGESRVWARDCCMISVPKNSSRMPYGHDMTARRESCSYVRDPTNQPMPASLSLYCGRQRGRTGSRAAGSVYVLSDQTRTKYDGLSDNCRHDATDRPATNMAPHVGACTPQPLAGLPDVSGGDC